MGFVGLRASGAVGWGVGLHGSRSRGRPPWPLRPRPSPSSPPLPWPAPLSSASGRSPSCPVGEARPCRGAGRLVGRDGGWLGAEGGGVGRGGGGEGGDGCGLGGRGGWPCGWGPCGPIFCSMAPEVWRSMGPARGAYKVLLGVGGNFVRSSFLVGGCMGMGRQPRIL